MRPTGVFRVDPLCLLQDQVREPRNLLSILGAMGDGRHTLEEIAKTTGLQKQNVSTYLGRLNELHLVERRTPATLPQKKRGRSRQGRWHLTDSYLRFYFRFIAPNQRSLELELMESVWDDIHEQMRAFIGATTFEELCRAWVLLQARRGRLSFVPEDVGSHWASDAQVDVVAINWRKREILLGECKWGVDRVSRAVLRELLELKTPKVVNTLPDPASWHAYHIFFARAGFTEAAQDEAAAYDMRLVDLVRLDQDLQQPLDR